MGFKKLQEEIHKHAREKGWYEKERNISEMLALIHSEISEALEEYRNPHYQLTDIYEVGGKPEGFPIELADAVIRILDLCEYLDIDLATCIKTKMAYNKTRSYRHGNKKA